MHLCCTRRVEREHETLNVQGEGEAFLTYYFGIASQTALSFTYVTASHYTFTVYTTYYDLQFAMHLVSIPENKIQLNSFKLRKIPFQIQIQMSYSELAVVLFSFVHGQYCNWKL